MLPKVPHNLSSKLRQLRIGRGTWVCQFHRPLASNVPRRFRIVGKRAFLATRIGNFLAELKVEREMVIGSFCPIRLQTLSQAFARSYEVPSRSDKNILLSSDFARSKAQVLSSSPRTEPEFPERRWRSYPLVLERVFGVAVTTNKLNIFQTRIYPAEYQIVVGISTKACAAVHAHSITRSRGNGEDYGVRIKPLRF
jgi:hypothetical protein